MIKRDNLLKPVRKEITVSYVHHFNGFSFRDGLRSKEKASFTPFQEGRVIEKTFMIIEN